MDILKIEKKPHSTMMEFNGTIELDKLYTFVLQRTQASDGEITYECFVRGVYEDGELHQAATIKDDVRWMVEHTVEAYAAKMGINN
jgi:hypothetical protein